MRLYRVLPYLPTAAGDEPGGVLFRPAGGKNRVDPPVVGQYRVLYAGSDPAGCIAEAFGRFDVWDRTLIESDPATPLLPGSRFALATYELPDDVAILDLDDAQTLLEWQLHPSQVVSRDRNVTQAWAARMYAAGAYGGVRWWSYYDSGWSSVGLWDVTRLTPLGEPRVLRIDDADIARAAGTIVRRYVTG